MKPTIAAATVLTLVSAALGACTPSGQPPVRTALDCPAEWRDLKRQSVAADRKTCSYLTENGGEVTLRLVDTHGDPDAALKAVEAALTAGLAPAQGAAMSAPADASRLAADAKRVADEAAADAAAGADEMAQAAPDAEAKQPAVVEESGVKPWRHGRETAHVQLPGVNITADDDDANVRIGPMHILAGEDGAVVHMSRDVRLRGESLSPRKRGVRATFIYTGDQLADGYSFVGYEAGGPKSGPLTVAVVKSRKPGRDSISHDVTSLVRRNGGV